MDEVIKLALWLERHGYDAPWEHVELRFRRTFRQSGNAQGQDLNGLLISTRGLPLYGKMKEK